MYSPVDEIKSRLDIVDLIQGYLRLQKAGRNYKACCPFHNEKTPSLMISPEKQMWHCFGCGKGGSVFDFVMEMDGLEFGDALRVLAQRAGVELKTFDGFNDSAVLRTERSRIYEICDLAARFFETQLEKSQTGKTMRQYLCDRGLQTATIKDWRLGYAPGEWRSLYNFLIGRGYADEEILKSGLIIKNSSTSSLNKYYDRFRDRIIFPIFDLNGLVVGFTGRENPHTPDSRMGKYVNIANTLIFDKSKILYGFDRAKTEIRTKDLCILVEGQVDVIMARQAGFKNVVACSGTALTEQHLKIIKRYTANLATAFDSDLAGEMATKRGIDLAIQFGFNVKIIDLPSGQDPADCLLKDVSTWSRGVANSKKIIEFYIDHALAGKDTQTIESKKQIAGILLPVIKKIPNKIEQSYWLQELSRRANILESDLREELDKIKDNFNNNSLARPLIENNNPVDKKTPNLEEYALGLILSDASKLAKVEDESSEIFLNENFRKIFEQLKGSKGDLNNFKANLSSQLVSQIDYLIFKAEAYKTLFGEDDSEKEIDFCVKQLKNRFLHSRQQQYSLAIKQAESRQDEITAKKLTEELNNFIKETS